MLISRKKNQKLLWQIKSLFRLLIKIFSFLHFYGSRHVKRAFDSASTKMRFQLAMCLYPTQSHNGSSLLSKWSILIFSASSITREICMLSGDWKVEAAKHFKQSIKLLLHSNHFFSPSCACNYFQSSNNNFFLLKSILAHANHRTRRQGSKKRAKMKTCCRQLLELNEL